MNKRLVLSMFLWASLPAAFLSSCNNKPTDNGPKPIRVAAILNLTGPAARFDAVKQQALELATERVKSQHTQIPIEMRILDAGGGPEATTVAVRQATEWGASYFLSGTSPSALAIASQVRGRTPPVVQIANAANPDFGPPRPGEYRFWPDWRQEAEIVIGILKSQNLTKVLLIHSADPYSEALTKDLREQGKAISSLVIAEQQYDPASTPDFRPALLRAKQDGVQALIIFGLPPGIKALISQMAEVKWDRAMIGGVNINLAVQDYDNAHLAGPLWVVETEAMREQVKPGSEVAGFREAFRQKYNETPPFHALYLADALYFIVAAHEQSAAPNTSEVDRVKAVRSFEGASGHIDVVEDGNLRFEMNARKVR
jgi:ABC-type branched-subunit amino acid transport system substrate-binding protein